MQSTVSAESPTYVRWLLFFALSIVCYSIIHLVALQTPMGSSVLHTAYIAAIALAVYAWLLYNQAVAILVNIVVFACLGWAWGNAKDYRLGIDLVALAALLVAAGLHRNKRLKRVRRLSQVLSDLDEQQMIKEQAVAHVQKSREALQKKHGRYAQLQTIAEQLSALTDLEGITTLAVEQAFSLIGKSDVCLLYLLDRGKQELALVASKRASALSAIRAKHGDQFDRYVLRTHRPLLVTDVRRDFRFTVNLESDRAIHSVIACPLLLGQSAEGVLRMDSPQSGAYNQDDLRFLDILLDLVSTAVTNSKLFAQTQQLAMTDGVTGLTLRRPFLEQMNRELARVLRSGEPLSVMMIDVDHFKRYNDTYGHTAGDLVLKAVADLLREAVPDGANVARYGGEEFAVLLLRTELQEAARIAESIRRSVSKISLHTLGTEVPAVTVSIGVAAAPNDAKAEVELIRVADQRLYQAKHAGRNNVCSS